MSNILYHSAYGGTLVFEPNDSLEHAVTKEKIAERYNSNRNPGNYGSKNTGRDKYTGLYQAGEAAKERQLQQEQVAAEAAINKKLDKFCDKIKTAANMIHIFSSSSNKNMSKKDLVEALKEAATYEVVINQKGEITIGDLILVPRGSL